MKICAVTPNYPPGSRVGAWLASHQFLAHAAAEGHEVDVYPQHMPARPDYTIDGVLVHGRPNWHATVGAARTADVIVSHAGDGGQILDVDGRHVRMVHGVGWTGIDRADLAVFASHTLADLADWSGPRVVCPPPTDPAHFTDLVPGNQVTLVNLTREKGVETFWQVADLAPARRFLGVRGGYGEQVIPRAPNVTVAKTVADIRTVLAETRVLMVPSIFESWCMVAVEAMAAGVPVIAHPCPGLVESLGDAGLFADRDDPAAWVELLDELDDPDVYAAQAAKGRARAVEIDHQSSLDRWMDAVEGLCVPV